MIKKIIFLIASTVVSLTIYSQNDPFVSLNMFNHMFYNPGYAGDGNEIEAKLLAREQWMGFKNGAPQIQFFNIDAPFKLFRQQHGVGMSIINDKIGNMGNIGLNMSYAYRKKLMQGSLGIGVGLNMINSNFSGTWKYPENNIDPNVPAVSEKPLVFDMNFGLYYSSDNLFLSISGRNLANSSMKFKEPNKKNTYIGRQIYFSTGYNYQLSNPMFAIKPIVFLGTDFSSTQASVTGILSYNRRFFGGIGVKMSNEITDVTVLAGIDLPSGIEVSLAYDINTTRIRKVSSGSFELMLGYSFNLDMDKDNRKHKSIRYL